MGLRQTIGAAVPVPRRPVYDRYLPEVQDQLDSTTFNSAWAEGQAMTLEQIVAASIRQPQATSSKITPHASPPQPLNDLTPREVEVLRLVAQGLTDAQIAEKLVISRHTVHSHLSSIYSKLGVTSRTSAAHFAVTHKLSA